MNAADLLAQLRDQCGEAFDVTGGDERLDIHVPFFLPDGDGMVIVAERGRDGWRLTDDGMTSAYLETQQVEWTNQRLWLAEDAAGAHGVKLDAGALVKPLSTAPDWYDLAEFIQSITHLTSVEFAGQRQPQGEQFRTLTTARLKTIVADEQLVIPRYRDKQRDREGDYAADQGVYARADAPRPSVLTFAVGSAATSAEVAIRARQWREWEHEVPRLIVVREGAGVHAKQWRYLRDASPNVMTWADDDDQAVRDFLADFDVPLAAA